MRNVEMVALITFNGDSKEGLHIKGQSFLTSEGRASKYESHLPRLAERVGIVEEVFVPVKDETPHLPKERKVVAPKAKKKAPVKKKAPPPIRKRTPVKKTARKR